MQADSSPTRGFGGTGCRRAIFGLVVDGMVGILGVTSVPGGGLDLWPRLRMEMDPDIYAGISRLEAAHGARPPEVAAAKRVGEPADARPSVLKGLHSTRFRAQA